MRFIFKILSKLLALFFFVIFIIIAIKNYHGVDVFFLANLKLTNVPIFLIIFVSFIFGSIANFIFLMLNKKK